MSQRTDILRHLRRKPITPVEALSKYGCFRLAARIADLRETGYDIRTETLERGGKRYARYRLVR